MGTASKQAGNRAGSLRALLVLGSLSLALGLLLVLCPGEHLAERWVLAEDYHKGNVARELLLGPILPPFDYHHVPNAGGTLVVGALAAPCFLLFGPTLFAVRLVPILFAVATVLGVFCALDRVASRRAAWIGGMLVAIATPGYALISVTSQGSHTENNALTFLCVGVYCAMRTGATARPSIGQSSLLGVAAGFAVYFGYMSVIALAALGAYELAARPRILTGSRLLALAAGFAVGFAPWIAYNAMHGFAGTRLYGSGPDVLFDPARVGSRALDNAVSLLASYLPQSFFFVKGPIVPREVLEWAYATILAVLFAAGSARILGAFARARAAGAGIRDALGRDPRFVFLLYPILFACAFALVDMHQAWMNIEIAHGGRYVTPLFPFLASLAAIGADAFWTRLRLLPAALLALGLSGSIAVLGFDRVGAGLREPGTSQEEFARWLAWRYKLDRERTETIVTELGRRRSREELDGVVFVFAQTLKWRIQRIDAASSPRPETRAELLGALEHLRSIAPSEMALYCDPPVQGERAYRYAEREIFRADHARGELGNAPRAEPLESGSAREDGGAIRGSD